jgi:exopolysaccharide production protein ExoZ
VTFVKSNAGAATIIMRPRTASKRLHSLDLLRVAAACLIVFYHVHTILSATIGHMPFDGIFRSGSSRGVDLFFVLNGFTLPYCYSRDLGRPAQWATYCYRRLVRIYPSVWLMTALAAGLYFTGFGGAEKVDKLTIDNVIASVLLLPQEGTPLVNVTWTLKYVVFFYSLFGLAILNRRFGLVALGLWQAAIVSHAILGVASATWDRFYLQPIGLEFGVGMVCALLVRRCGRADLPLPIMGPALALGLGLTGFAGFKLLESHAIGYLPGLPAALLFGVCSGAIIAGASLLELGRRLVLPRSLAVLSAATFSIYLVNFSVITLATRALILAGLAPTSNGLAFALAALGVGAGLAFHQFVDLPIQNHLAGGLSLLKTATATLLQRAGSHPAIRPQGCTLAAFGGGSGFTLPADNLPDGSVSASSRSTLELS